MGLRARGDQHETLRSPRRAKATHARWSAPFPRAGVAGCSGGSLTLPWVDRWKPADGVRPNVS
jgi:hypothetical protein